MSPPMRDHSTELDNDICAGGHDLDFLSAANGSQPYTYEHAPINPRWQCIPTSAAARSPASKDELPAFSAEHSVLHHAPLR
jgi:hypothetical protein